MGYQPNTADIIANILQGSTNVEGIITANSLDQMTAPAAAVTFTGVNGAERLTHLLPAVLTDGAPTVGQLAGNQIAYVVSGCVWTADAAGSTTNGSMTAGTVMIKGLLLTVNAITAHSFASSSDTYIDITDPANNTGVATVNFTAVSVNGLSPALVSSGTMFNTIRVAVVSTGSTSIVSSAAILQGALVGYASGVTLGSSTVAAGSSGQALNALTSNQLAVASGSSFSTAGGWIQIARTSSPVETDTVRYTGVSTNNLTGITSGNIISGTPTGTVTTGDTVTAVSPLGVTDTLGNLIYPTGPYPRLIGFAYSTNAFTSTSTAAIPFPSLIAPYILTGPPNSRLKITLSIPFVTSSATAGTTVVLQTLIGNALSGGHLWGYSSTKVAVSGDGSPVSLPSVAQFGQTGLQAAGSYTAQVSATQGAAGTMTLGILFALNTLSVELV